MSKSILTAYIPPGYWPGISFASHQIPAILVNFYRKIPGFPAQQKNSFLKSKFIWWHLHAKHTFIHAKYIKVSTNFDLRPGGCKQS